jgi:hypothetical protein
MRTQAIQVRAAEPADHTVIRDILRNAYGQYTPDICQVWKPFRRPLDLDGTLATAALVAVVDDAIAGYAAFTRTPPYRDSVGHRAGPGDAVSRWIPPSGATASPRRC